MIKAVVALVILSFALGCTEAKAADTGDALGNTVTDLSIGANYLLSILPLAATTTDLQLSGSYTGGTTLTINGAALNFGTLNDLVATQLLTISNTSTTAGSLTLNTAANSTAGANASDLLYVAAGGNLKIQSGAGTLTLNILTSGNIDNAGILNISAPVSIAALTTTTFTGTGATTISGSIGALLGSVAVNDAGGSVTLSGNNAYIGNTTITSGTLVASNIVVSGGVSNLGNAVTNVILGGATTAGVLSYTGNTATYTRGFTANAGGGEVDVTTAGETLTIGSGAVTTSGSGVFTIGGAGNTSITSVIGGGSGGLTKTGTGTLNLSASNGYAGTTNVNGGVLQINAANNLGSAAATNTIGFNGGTLESTANSYALGTTRAIAINGAGTIQVDAGGALTVNGLLSGAGTLTEAGAGTLVLSGANTGFAGAFVQSAGTLSLANTAAFSASNAVTINAGTFDLNGNATETIGSLSGTGGILTNSSATSSILTLGGSGSTTYSGTISAPSATATPTILGLTVALTGSGSQNLSGADTYTGLTTVSGGKLILGSATALGNSGLVRSVGTGGTTIGSGGTLDLNGQANINEVLTLNGTGVGSNGALINGSATAATIGSGVSSINVSGTFTGLNANTTVSIGAPTSGTTAAATASLGVTASTFNITGGSTVYTGAPTVTISGGGGTGATAVANLSGGVVTGITITNAGSGFTSLPTISFSGGSVLLSGTNPTGTGVDGHFTLDGIAVTNNGSGYTTTPTVSVSSGSVTTTANLTGVALASNSSVGGIGNLTVNAAISGSGTGLTKVGTDTLTLGAVESYTGATAISAGSLAVGVANAIATSTSLGISGGGVLSLGANSTMVNGDVTLTSGSITGTGTLTASSTGTSYSVINGTVSAVLGGAGDTLVKVTDGTVGGGTVILSGANIYTGATAINAGTLQVDGSLASASALTIGGASGSATPTLTGTGTINGAVTVSSANGGVAGIVNPGDSGTGTLTVGSITIQNGGVLSLDVSGATTDLLKVTNAATLVAGAGIQIVGNALTQGDYVLATAASGLNSASLTVVGSLPSGYKLLTSSTELDLQHLADQTLTSTTSANLSIIINTSTPIGALLSNVVPVGSSFLNVNLTDGGGAGGVVTGLTSSAGTTILGGASSTIVGTLTATTAGLGETWIVKNTDLGALTTSVTATGTLNVYNHALPTLTVTTGNNQSVFVGGTLVNASLTLSDTTGVYPAPLDVNTLVHLTGATGSGVVPTGGTGTYTTTALSAATAGIGQTLSVSLNAGDQQTILGAGPLSVLSQTVTYNVYNHATPTLTIGSGNNQSVFVNGTLTGATLTLADTTVTAPVPLDVSNLNNLTGTTGSAVIASGSTGTYTVTGFNTTSAGIGQTLVASLKAGDEQSITGANALTTLSQTLTYNVYNHATPTLTLTTGNNQSGFVGSTLSAATFTLADNGTLPAPLDVNTLANLTGSTGTGVVASGGSGIYTSTTLSTATAGIGETLAVSLKAGDEQSINGANALSTLGQTVTYNVYNHSTPTLTIGTGNNQSVFLNGTLTGATLTLADTTGTVPAPLDVSTLSNLTGATGSGIIGSGSTGIYTVTGFNTATLGIGKTLVASLKAGDQQTISGANALGTVSQTLTYNVYNHSTPTLTIGTGNNQSVFVNGSVNGATVTLADAGTVPAPLDVNTLNNLTGSTGSAVIASNSTGIYTATGFNTTTVGIGQTLLVSLKAGDAQSISGANALTTLSQTLTYNVYNHSTPTLVISTGNNQSAIIGSTLANATLTLVDAGTLPVPLDVSTLANLTGTTGSAVIGSGSSGTYTSTALSTATAGIGQTLAVSLKAGDEQSIAGANALSTLGQTVIYNVYNHSTPTLSIGSGNNQSVFLNGTLSAATLTLSDTTGLVPAPLDVSTLTNLLGTTGSGVIGSGSSGTYSATGFNTTTAGIGKTLAVSLKSGDQQTVSGANALTTLNQSITYNVYNHSTPTLTITIGNNQSGIIGSTLATATLTLADAGTVPAPLDVNSLSNLSGASGSGVIASGGTGTYAAASLNTSTIGVGQTLTVSLNAGDEQSISGANPLSALSQTITYNVYNHSTPTLTIGTGNNQSVFINGTITGSTLTLSDTGTTPAPLDVSSLTNLTGATGSGVIGSGSTGTYTVTGFNTSTAGMGQTVVAGLTAGDQQTDSGANPLGTLSQTVTYNVYNHATPTLTIGSGNNQSAFVNGTIIGATVVLADTTGTVPAPLDVNTLTNLTGATGSGIIASGSTGTYTATGYNTSVAGLGQTLAVGLKAGDQQTISGANPLTTLSQGLTYNIYNHATPLFTPLTGANQSGIVGSTLAKATYSLTDSGTVPVPLDVNSLSNLTGATGLGVVASGGSGTYTSTTLNTAAAGIGQTLVVGLNAGDAQSIPGANPLSAFSGTVIYNVYNHSTPTLTIAGGNNQSIFVNASLTAATLTLADSGTVPAPLDVSTLANLTGATGSGVIGSNASGTYTVTGFNSTVAGIGKTLTVSLKSGDTQAITGANPLTTLSQSLTYNVYNHSTPTLVISSGNNQSGIVGSTLANATLSLSDGGTAPAPLDVSSLTHLTGTTGSGVVASGATGTYVSTSLNSLVLGIGQTLIASLSAGDQQTLSGANALGTLSQTITYNIYNHSTPTLTLTNGNNQSVFVGTSITGATLTLSDTGATPAPLDVNSLTNLSGATGSGVIASGSTGLYTATGFNTSTAGIGQTLAVSLNAGDQQTVAGANALTSFNQIITYNVYNHSTPTLSIATGNNQSGFVGATLVNPTLTLADNGTLTVPLDVNSLSSLTGAIGSAVINSGALGTYTTTSLNTATAGIGQTLTVSLKAGDEQSLSGANPLSTLSQTITYNVYNHATPTLTVGSGNNQSAFVNGPVTGATVTLGDSGTAPAPLDVNTLVNLTGTTGLGVIGSNSSGLYTVTGFNTSTAGIGQTLTVGLRAGDEQSITGANPLSTLTQTYTYNVYNHATPTLTITSGNNQSVFVNSTVIGATLTLADAGTVPAPLDVNSLGNLSGSTGSGVIGSNSSGTYIATGFNTSAAGLGQTLVVSLKAGDEQIISGANALGTLTQTLTYNVYNHATPTLSIVTGNNQSAIVGNALANATLTLADTGSTSVPLDVNTLNNLTGATGTNIIGPGATGTYMTSTLNTATAGIGQTLTVSLSSGDEQALAGANALSTLGQTIIYNVYNHSTPTLTIATGNNQSGIVGSTLANATVTLADTGTLPAPLDVNSLSNLSGTTGSGVIGSGASGTYTSTAFNTSTAGLGQTMTVGLMAGDQHTVAGANPLTALTQTVTYNVYNHSAPTLTLTSGNNQTVFLTSALTAPTVMLSDAAGTLAAPLDVNTLNNLIGSTGSGIVASGASATYTATGFNTSAPGQNQTLTVGLNAGDQQTITGANPLTNLSQTITYNVVEHAESTLTSGTLTLGVEHVGYTSLVTSANALSTTNGTVQSNRVDLQGDAPAVGAIDLTGISNVSSGATDQIWATLAPGQGVGVINTPMTYVFADQTALPGALSNVGTAAITVQGLVYSGQSIWTGNGATTAVWGTLATSFGTDWGTAQGSPGLDSSFADIDSATFGNVNGMTSQMVMLNGANPSLHSITFDASSTSYTIAAGTGGNITLDGDNTPSTVTDNATGGTQTISAPIVLVGDPIINVAAGDTMVFSGAISGVGDLVTVGPGTAVLSATNTYTGPTTINAGTLEVDGSLAASSAVTIGGASASGSPTLSGTGTVNGSVTVSSAAGGDFGTINPGMPGIIGALTVGSITFQSGSLFALDASGANSDVLTINNAATIVAGANIEITASGLTQGTYVLATAASGLNSNAFTVVGSVPTGYVLVATATSLDLQHLGAAGFVSTSPGTLNMIAGSTTTIGATLSNGAPSGSTVLAVNLADNGGTGGTVSGLTSSSGSTVASGASSNVSGTLTAGGIGLGQTWSIKNTDPNAIMPVVTAGGTVNVYNHSAANFTTAGGNNQSAIVGSTLTSPTFTLANAGTLPVLLDVTTLVNLIGTTGSGVVGSNSTGTYTASALNTSTAGVGKTLTVSLNAGDQQTVIGANPLSNFSQTITYNVYNHATPTLSITSGNNQSGIVGSTLASPMLGLNNTTGTVPAPLDVNTLTNLTGASGTGAVGSGLSSAYAASALSTATAGIGQTILASLKAGDSQLIVGANPLSTLSQTITYNVYNHATPTLAISAGNNQSAIVGSTLSTPTLILSDMTGVVPAPLDVSALVNLIGASGPGTVASGGAVTYTSAPLNTTTAGIGQTLAVSLMTGDAQSVVGANPLSTISQNVTYNVYNHSTATLSIGTGNNQSVFVNNSVTGATVTLADMGTVPAPIEVTTLSNLTGTTGVSAVASGASGTYTVTGFNTSAVGLGQTVGVSLKAGDNPTIVGANPLGTLNQTLTYNVFNHATSNLASGTLNLGNIHVGYANPVTSGNSLTTTNGAVNDLRVNLQGSAPTSGNLSLNSLSGIGSGSTGTILATLATGHGVGAINTPLTYTFADQSAITGASSNVGTAAITVNGEVYSGQGVWAGNATAGGSWGTLATSFGVNWGANQGSPGLDSNFTSTDTAAFGNVNGQASQLVTLDGANPSLNSITFNASSTSYNLAQGSSGTVTLNGGAGSALITDNATGGTQTISAPVALATNTNVTVATNRKLIISGTISGTGGLTTMGPGTTVLAGTDIYTGATTINTGTLAISGSTLASGTMMVGNGGTLAGTGSTGVVTVAGGGSINLQDGLIGTLTTNGLTVGNAVTASTLSFDIAAGAANNLDHIADSGALVLNGAAGTTITIGAVSGTPVLTSGTYTLISSTGITGTLADLSLSRTTLDGKSLALALSPDGDSLDLVVSDLTTTTTYSLTASASANRIMVGTGSTTITSTIINSGSADTLTYTGLSASTTAGTLTGVAQNGGPLAENGGTGTGSTVLSNVGTTGMVTITPTVTSANNTTFGTSALPDSATPTTVDVVTNRVVTASSVAFGRVIVGQAVSSTSTLSTTGDDADFTRVTVGTASADANGISATGGNTAVFNGPSVTDMRTVGGIFSTAGSTSGNLTMTTTGEGLAGEAPINVGLSYTADPVSKRVITNGAVTNLGLLHTGAVVSATSSAFTTTGIHDTTTDVIVAAGSAVADANGVTLSGAATTFTGTSSDTRTFGGTINSTTGGTVSGSFGLGVTTLENAGAGLAGEGVYNPVDVNYTAFVYTGNGVWNASGGGNWGTIAAPANWTANGGTPGLDSNFTSTDSATFGNSIGSTSALVTLDGDSPSLNAITFANTAGGSYTIAQGTSGTLLLNGGAGSAMITNANGNNTISAPAELDTNATIATAANTSLTLAGNIREAGGAHALILNGTGRILLTGANTYSGGTTISAGTVLAGSATAFGAGNVTMNGGTLETGNGMHQINVAQNYTQTGGTLVLNLSGTAPGTAGGYEFLNVVGTANLGGALQVIVQPVYIPVNGDTFTFVQAGTITGGFTGETSNLRALSITPQGVGTIVITQLPFTTMPGVSNNPNRRIIAAYIDKIYLTGYDSGPFNTLVGALDGLTDESWSSAALGDAFDQLTTEKFHNFVRETVFNNASFSTQTLDGYIASRRSASGDFLPGDGTIDSSNLTLNDPNMDPGLAQVGSHLLAWSPAPLPHGLLSDSSTAIPTEFGLATPPPSTKGHDLSLFVAGNVTLAQGFSQTDLAHFNSTTAGVQVGASYRLAPHLEAGAFFNYSHADGTLDNIGSKATIDTFAPGVFISYANKGWYGNAMASYGFNNFTEDRGIAFGGLSGTSRGNPNGGQVVADLDGGYDFHLNHWTFGPSAGLQYANESVSGFTESGYAPTDLRVSDAETSSLRSRIGVHASRTFQVKKATITPHIDAFWQHEFMDEGQGITASLANVGEGSFTVTTPRSSRDSALIDVGLDANLNGQVSVYLDYLVQAGQTNYFGQSIQAGVKISF